MSEEYLRKKMEKAAVLVVDDPLLIGTYSRILDNEPYAVVGSPNPAKALEMVNGRQTSDGRDIAVVVSGGMMPMIDGRDLLARVKESNPEVVRVLVSSVYGAENGVSHYHMTKPFDSEDFRRTVGDAMDLYFSHQAIHNGR